MFATCNKKNITIREYNYVNSTYSVHAFLCLSVFLFLQHMYHDLSESASPIWYFRIKWCKENIQVTQLAIWIIVLYFHNLGLSKNPSFYSRFSQQFVLYIFPGLVFNVRKQVCDWPFNVMEPCGIRWCNQWKPHYLLQHSYLSLCILCTSINTYIY